jgi:hypothetical protein
MRIRTTVVAVGTVLAGAVIAATVAAGPASALRPVIDPANGVYAGVALDHGETAAVANTPIPALVEQAFPGATYDVDPASQLPQRGGLLYADLPAVVGEAAGSPQGRIGFALVDPSRNHGSDAVVVEVLH